MNSNEVEDFDDDMLPHFADQSMNNQIQAQTRVLKQAEIADSLKPQYYFNAKGKIDIGKLQIQDSDQESKESTSKTPCFIGTPTSGSQLGSLNGTGGVKAEELISAIYRNNQILQSKFMNSSSNNSS